MHRLSRLPGLPGVSTAAANNAYDIHRRRGMTLLASVFIVQYNVQNIAQCYVRDCSAMQSAFFFHFSSALACLCLPFIRNLHAHIYIIPCTANHPHRGRSIVSRDASTTPKVQQEKERCGARREEKETQDENQTKEKRKQITNQTTEKKAY